VTIIKEEPAPEVKEVKEEKKEEQKPPSRWATQLRWDSKTVKMEDTAL